MSGFAPLNVAHTTGAETIAGDKLFSGVMRKTGQPAFSAAPSGTLTDVTGDGTSYVVIWATEHFDQASNFNTGTGQFTAPVDGKYLFCGAITASGALAGHTRFGLFLVTSNRTLTIDAGDITPDNNTRVGIPFSFIVDMEAADTTEVRFMVEGSTKVIDILASGLSHFSGALIA